MWATDTSYDLTADGSDIGTGEVDFDDLMDTLDAAFQVVGEAGITSRWSVFIDLTYLKTSDDQTVELNDLGTLRIDTESKQTYVDAAIAFWPWGEAGGFNVYGGIRYTKLDDESKVDLIDPVTERLGVIKFDRDFTDALLGARYRFDLGDNWSLHSRVDYGFADSEGVFQAQAVVRWAVGRQRRHGVMFGYRYKEAEFKSGAIEENYDYKGPVVGFNFRF